MATLDNGLVTLTPDLVLTWNAARTTGTVVHAIIGRPNPDIVLRDTLERGGTLELFFLTEADAQEAQDELSVPGVWVLDSPALRFVAAGGNVTLEYVGENLNRYVVRSSYQEVTA